MEGATHAARGVCTKAKHCYCARCAIREAHYCPTVATLTVWQPSRGHNRNRFVHRDPNDGRFVHRENRSGGAGGRHPHVATSKGQGSVINQESENRSCGRRTHQARSRGRIELTAQCVGALTCALPSWSFEKRDLINYVFPFTALTGAMLGHTRTGIVDYRQRTVN